MISDAKRITQQYSIIFTDMFEKYRVANNNRLSLPFCGSSMEGQSGQKEHLLILINDLLVLINDLLILINGLLI